MSDSSIIILGIDPSTDITGAALVEFDRQGPTAVYGVAAFSPYLAMAEADYKKADACTQKQRRIYEIRGLLSTWLDAYSLARAQDGSVGRPVCHIAAYEGHTWRGKGAASASEALSQATGAYLALFDLRRSRIMSIEPGAARQVYSRTYIKDREAKKKAAIAWAHQEFGAIQAGLIAADLPKNHDEADCGRTGGLRRGLGPLAAGGGSEVGGVAAVRAGSRGGKALK